MVNRGAAGVAAAGDPGYAPAMADSLETQLRQQLTAAMKAKDSASANLVRMINTKIMERRTAPGFTGQVDDALILDVIRSYRKNMEKARAEFVAVGDRGKEQVEQIDFELAWCATMLPAGVDEWHLIEREIDDFELVFLRNEDAVAQMGRGRLTREELAILELVNGKHSVKEIIRKSRLGSFEVSKMLYRLLSIKLVRRRVMPVAV